MTQRPDSPFFPSLPVPSELFVGRSEQLARILRRGIEQVVAGKPVAMFVAGDYGIGKTSIARVVQRVAGTPNYGLDCVEVSLGGAKSMEDVYAAVMTAVARLATESATRWERLKDVVGRFVGDQQLEFLGVGFTLNAAQLRSDAPRPSNHHELLAFLRTLQEKLGNRGLMLVLDDVNGLASQASFAQFLKSFWEANAPRSLATPVLPILLMLCGTPDRWRELVEAYQPVGRVFDLVNIDPLGDEDVRQFFVRAFGRVGLKVDDDALALLCQYSSGYPRLMHLVGDSAFWANRDGVIDSDDARNGVRQAAEDFGRKFVEPQVYDALRSDGYRSILRAIGSISPPDVRFTREQVTSRLKESERKKFDNFITKMKAIGAVRQAPNRGEYDFSSRLFAYYIHIREGPNSAPTARRRR